MPIAAISSASVLQSNNQDSFRQAFGQLISALQSGNLTAAQSAYTALTHAGNVDPNSPIGQALSQIGDALKSGDIGKTQQALASLQQQLQALKGAHHHRHHQSADSPQSAGAAFATTAASGAASSTSTSLVDVTA